MPYSTRTSDVWSLGVSLVNVLTGRNPWRIASASHDAGYAQYIQDGPKFLLSVLPISVEAAHLLARIFDPNPQTRVTIPQLRRAIVKVQTFFPPDTADQPEGATLVPEVVMKETEALESLLQVTLEPVKPASLVPFVPLVYTTGISDGVGGLNEAVAGSVGSKAHSWCSNRLNGVLQFVVIAFPLQCASTSE